MFRMYPRVSIHIAARNGLRFLPDLLASVFEQTYGDFHVLVVDNGSNDGTDAWLRQEHPHVTVLRLVRPVSAGAAINHGLRYAFDHWTDDDLSDRFLLLADQTALLAPDMLERLLDEAQSHPHAGAFGGKLLRAFGENQHDEVMRETVRSDRIESVGLRARRNRTFRREGAGDLDQGQYEQPCEVFGFPADLALYRASALEAVRCGEERFDQDLEGGTEAADLAWRLQAAGWSARFVPSAVGYRYRGTYERRRGHQPRDPWIRRMKHQWGLLYKNESLWNVLLAFPWLLGFFLASTVFVWTQLPRFWKKRRQVQGQRAVPLSSLRRWFV